jgi:hypothetical protein
VESSLTGQLERLADDVGRFRRFVHAEDEYTGVLLDRIARDTELAYWAVTPTAGERYRELRLSGLGEDEAVRTALSEADGLSSQLRTRLAQTER